MHRLTILLLFYSVGVLAQTDSLVNSGLAIEKSKHLYDSNKYELAIKELSKIDPRDTNYVYSLSELSKSYYELKKYKEVISICSKGLEVPSKYRSTLFNYQAMAYAADEQMEKAYATIQAGLKEFPLNFRLTYRYGVLLYDDKKFEEAEKQFFKTLEQNPYSSGAHLYLGTMSMLRGQKIKGMMAMGIYVALNNTNNNQLVILEHFVNNELSDENTIPVSENPFDRWDEIIRAKISSEEDYKIKIPIDVGIVKQYQIFFELLKEKSFEPKDHWIDFYLKIYKDLLDQGSEEAFVYHLLTSTPIKTVDTWKDKHKKEIKQFYDVINKSIKQITLKRVLPQEWGYREPINFTYYEDGNTESIGAKDAAGKKTGPWYYFSDFGVKQAEGSYDAGKKIGTWRFYNNSGVVTSIENYDTGEIKIMNEEGRLNRAYTLKDEKVEGEFKWFYGCGQLSEVHTYKAGKNEGAGKSFFFDGKLQSEFTYKNDSLQGKFINRHANGKVESEMQFDKGKRVGKFTSYYSNGVVKSTGSYDKGKATGEWLFYYENGGLKEKGIYKNNITVGEWRIYNTMGELDEIRTMNELGEYDGDNSFFYKNKPSSIYHYAKEKITSATFFDSDGKVLSKGENTDGTFSVKGLYITGEPKAEHNYVNGLREGAWKFFYRNGQLHTSCQYKKGLLEGEYLEYYEDGTLSIKSYYVDGKLNGYYTAYHSNGALKMGGWYQKGLRQQKWFDYFQNGKIETDAYYLNDQITGYIINYSEDEKLFSKIEYNIQGKIKKYIRYDQAENPNSTETSNGLITSILQKSKTDQTYYSANIGCGEWNGETVLTLNNGKPFKRSVFNSGYRTGEYVIAFPDGTIEGIGHYLEDKATGKWTWFQDNGKKSSEGRYVNGSRDSVWTQYDEDGFVSSRVNYLENEKHGEAIYYDTNEKPVLIKMYNGGTLISYRATGKDGILSDWIPFKGNGKIICYFSNGSIAIEENYKKGLYDQTRKFFHPNGNLWTLYNYKNDLTIGECFIYYKSGKVKEKMIYKDDLPDGLWEYYDPEGRIIRKEPYVLGNLNGVTEFFKDGKKIGSQKFRGGCPVATE
ncbi:MAG: hypothetical protein JSS79_11830 [Bacteroidetes bacterium]|nr:hypothetical protein [Bacteroidota bacterium]